MSQLLIHLHLIPEPDSLHQVSHSHPPCLPLVALVRPRPRGEDRLLRTGGGSEAIVVVDEPHRAALLRPRAAQQSVDGSHESRSVVPVAEGVDERVDDGREPEDGVGGHVQLRVVPAGWHRVEEAEEGGGEEADDET